MNLVWLVTYISVIIYKTNAHDSNRGILFSLFTKNKTEEPPYYNVSFGSIECTCPAMNSCQCGFPGGLGITFNSIHDAIGTNVTATFLRTALFHAPLILLHQNKIKFKLFEIYSKKIYVGINFYNTETSIITNHICFEVCIFFDKSTVCMVGLRLGCFIFSLKSKPHYEIEHIYRMIELHFPYSNVTKKND